MRKRMLMIAAAFILLCGCGSQGKEPSPKDDAVSLQVPGTAGEEEKSIPEVTVTEYPLPEEVAALEKLDLLNMGLYADKEQSMRNSNQLNFGYFTTDEEGRVYFADYTQNAIFRCGPEGEDKELFCEGLGDLHISNGYLYSGTVDAETLKLDRIIKVDIDTKESEILYEGHCGEILVMEDILYNSIPGLASMDLKEPDKGFTQLSEIKDVFLNTDGRYLLYNMVTDNTKFLFERGYILAWDTETETNYFLDSQKTFLLLTGNWLSYMDGRTGSRHVLDLKTGTDTDLGYYVQRASGDGENLYWVKQETGSFQIMHWDGEEIRELLTVEGREGVYGDVFLYLTEDYLYWMFEAELLTEADWGYYRLADGKIGRLN